MEIYQVQCIMDEKQILYYISMNISSLQEYIKLSAKSFLQKIALFIVFSLYSIRPSLQEHGIWDQVRVDAGKEFNLICHTQDDLQKFRTNIARKPFHKSKSTDLRALASFYFNGKICRTLLRSDFYLFFLSEEFIFCMISTVPYKKQAEKDIAKVFCCQKLSPMVFTSKFYKNERH